MEIILDINDRVINGEMDALEAFIELKKIDALLKTVMKGIQPEAIEEAEKHGKGEHDGYGAKFTVKNGAGRWSFKEVDEWVRMDNNRKNYEEVLKNAYKADQAGVQQVNQDGEIIALPEFTAGSPTISIKL